MRKFLMLMLCVFLASTLVILVSRKKKEEIPPASIEEVAPAEKAMPELPMELEPAEEAAPELPMELEPAEEAAPELPMELEPPEEELEIAEEELEIAEEALEIAEEALSILTFFDESVEEGRLEGRGLDALKQMIKTAGGYLESGRIEAACWMLAVAYKATPDYAEGKAAPELASMIQDLRKGLECKEPE